MGKIDAWVPKIPRLKSAKVSRFSYRDAAYTNDDIEGVENYDYTRDMNVPSLTKTDTEPSVLDAGARAQFSSLTKNALNHFFGRVSYNLNKVIDFLADFLDDFRVQGVETLRRSANFTLGAYTDGKKIRIANTNATNTITCTLPSGQKMNGNGTISIPAGRIIDIELIVTTWKDNLTGNLTGNASTSTKLATSRKIDSIDFDGTQDIDVIQPGTIFATVSDTADTGYLLCHGTAVSRITYARLFNKIGIKFGAGNGSTTFNLPDFREVALVGAGTNVLNASAISVHDTYTVGQFKDDQIEEHQHVEKVSEVDGSGVKGVMPRNSKIPSTPVSSHILTGDVYGGRSGTTTHGKQIGVNYQIKY